MFIRNGMPKGNYYYCSELQAKYIQKNGIPLLAIDGQKYIFVITNELKQVIDNMPEPIIKGEE